MKRTGFILLTLCLVLACAFTAFADQTYRFPVCELYSVDGHYEDDVGNSEDYSFHVPQINAATPDAEAINAEIAEKFGKQVEDQFEKMEKGLSLWFRKTGWDAYWSGSRLFLLVTLKNNGGYTDYAAYGYDFETGSRVTNESILEERGISKEAYLENLREAVRLLFDDIVKPFPEGVKTNLTREGMLERTLNWLDPEQPIFINRFGEIATIVEIETVAGAGKVQAIATPFSR